jgi:hypothetical protein
MFLLWSRVRSGFSGQVFTFDLWFGWLNHGCQLIQANDGVPSGDGAHGAEKFWLDVRVRETDRAHMNHYYAQNMAVEFSANGGESVCKLDNEVVTHQELQQYESGRDFHLNRMNAIWSKIQFKNNIAMKMFKYFKLDEYEGYIAKRAQAYYDNAINMIKLKEGDGKTSEPVTTADKK